MFKMKQLPIEEASDEQIKDFAETALGLDMAMEGATTRAKMLALMTPLHDKPFILVPDVPEHLQSVVADQIALVSAPAQQSLEGGMGAGDPLFRIKIGQTELPGGKHPVPVSVNGRTVVIQRNMTIDLPARFYYALLDAVRITIEQTDITDKSTRVEIETTNYPMNFISGPSHAEIAEWRARVDNVSNPA